MYQHQEPKKTKPNNQRVPIHLTSDKFSVNNTVQDDIRVKRIKFYKYNLTLGELSLDYDKRNYVLYAVVIRCTVRAQVDGGGQWWVVVGPLHLFLDSEGVQKAARLIPCRMSQSRLCSARADPLPLPHTFSLLCIDIIEYFAIDFFECPIILRRLYFSINLIKRLKFLRDLFEIAPKKI